MKGRTILKGLLGAATLSFLAWLAWRVESRWIRPPPADVNPWFPMRVGDRWTYHDYSSRHQIVFEVLSQEESPEGSFFRVQRRIGKEDVGFDVSVTSEGCWILNAGGEAFSPPFREFRFPPVAGEQWRYGGRLGEEKLHVSSRVELVSGHRCEITESSSLSGTTTFVLEKGKGVVRLHGKEFDRHGSARNFDWSLEEFRRGS